MTARMRRMTIIRPWLWLLPAMVLLLPFFVLPIAIVVRNSFNLDDPLGLMIRAWTLNNYWEIVSDSYYQSIYLNSLALALGTAVACLLICLPIAYYVVFCMGSNSAFLLWLVYTPLIISVIVRVFGWIIIISDSGILNSVLLAIGIIKTPLRWLYSTEGLTLGLVHRYLPLMMLPLITTMSKIDVNALKASRNLGASEWATIRTVVLPLSIPGVLVGSQLVFAGAISDFVLPILMGGTHLRLLAPTILSEALGQVNLARSAALASTMLVLVTAVILGTNFVLAKVFPWARNV